MTCEQFKNHECEEHKKKKKPKRHLIAFAPHNLNMLLADWPGAELRPPMDKAVATTNEPKTTAEKILNTNQIILVIT